MHEGDEEENFRGKLKARGGRIRAIPGWKRPDYGSSKMSAWLSTKRDPEQTWSDWLRSHGRELSDVRS
jgi:hypothetical protein